MAQENQHMSLSVKSLRSAFESFFNMKSQEGGLNLGNFRVKTWTFQFGCQMIPKDHLLGFYWHPLEGADQHTVDASEIPRPTTWHGTLPGLKLNWWVDPGFLVAKQQWYFHISQVSLEQMSPWWCFGRHRIRGQRADTTVQFELLGSFFWNPTKTGRFGSRMCVSFQHVALVNMYL